MKSRSSNMDLGMLAMPLGEGRQAPAQPELVDMRIDDIARLNALLSGASTSLQGQHDPGQQAQTGSLLASEPGINDDKLYRVCDAVARLWTGNGSQSLREVRAQLSPEVLSASWLRLFEQGGVLQIELTCGDTAQRLWLAEQLPRLAARLGLRLHRPLSLRLLDEKAALCATCLWPESEAA